MNAVLKRRVIFWLGRIDLVIVLLIPVLFLVGTYGFYKYYISFGSEELANITWLDAGYYMLRGFMLDAETPPGAKPWQLEIGRYFAPISLFVLIFKLLKSVIRREWPLWRTRWMSGHTIVCGLGDRGAWLCQELQRKDQGNVAGVEWNAHAAAIPELRQEGVVVINDNARDLAVLGSANVRRSKRVVIATGNDQVNLCIAREIAQEIRRSSKEPEIVAAVEGYEARDYFAERLWAASRIRVIGFRHYACLRLANDMASRLAKLHGPIPQHSPVVCVEAADAYRIEMLRALVMLVQIAGDQPLIIHVCGSDGRDQHYFEDLFPAAEMAVSLYWHQESAIKLLRGGADGFDNVDAAVFAMESAPECLHAAETFRQTCPNLSVLVYACMLDTGDLFKMACDQEQQKGRELCHLSDIIIKSLYQIDDEKDGSLFELCEKGAIAIAKKYDQEQSKTKTVEPFEQKSLFLQDSNRMAAMHAGIKRVLWNKRTPEMDDEQVIEHLCKCEHMRWIGFHVMQGWQPKEDGGEKDKERKLHPDIKPFSDLTSEEQRKDRDPVNWAIKREGYDR